MKVMRNIYILCLVLATVCIAGCEGMFGEFFDDPDNTGTAQWATPVKTAPSDCKFNAVAVDSEGNTYAVGTIARDEMYDFGGNSRGVSGKQLTLNHAVIVKYDAAGEAQWAKAVEASDRGISEFRGVGIDDTGNIYVVGSVGGWMDNGMSFVFGGDAGTLTVPDLIERAVIVKYSSSGVAQWVRQAAVLEDFCKFSSVAVDASGNSYVVGYVIDQCQYKFGDISLPVDGRYVAGYNPVIVKYDSAGIAQWATTVKSASNESNFSSVAVDLSGNAYAVGTVTGTGDFSFGNNTGNVHGTCGWSNTIIVKYNPDGAAQWASSIKSGNDNSQFSGVAVDRSGNAYAVGSVSGIGECGFGGNSEPFPISDGNAKSIIVKYDPSGIAQWATPVRSAPATCSFTGVAIDVVGNPYAVGVIDTTGSFDFGGKSAPVNGKYSSENAVIVKYNAKGNAQWETSVTEAGSNSKFAGVAVDRYGYSYAVGYVGKSGAFNFGGECQAFSYPIAVPGSTTILNTCIVKYY